MMHVRTGARVGAAIRLPTESEWQQAATGGDPRNRYPWGYEWNARFCNSDESGLSHAVAVGLYPMGATSQGAMDMLGNVWEWCADVYHDPDELRVSEEGFRAIRGGSWEMTPEPLRISLRGWSATDGRTDSLGFRVARDKGGPRRGRRRPSVDIDPVDALNRRLG